MHHSVRQSTLCTRVAVHCVGHSLCFPDWPHMHPAERCFVNDWWLFGQSSRPSSGQVKRGQQALHAIVSEQVGAGGFFWWPGDHKSTEIGQVAFKVLHYRQLRNCDVLAYVQIYSVRCWLAVGFVIVYYGCVIDCSIVLMWQSIEREEWGVSLELPLRTGGKNRKVGKAFLLLFSKPLGCK